MKHNIFLGLLTIVLLWNVISPSEMKARPNNNDQIAAFFECSSNTIDKSFISNSGWISSLYSETTNFPYLKIIKVNSKGELPFNLFYKKETTIKKQIRNYFFYTNSLHDADHVKLQRFNV